ncbi:MAG: transposase [Patescibacteria group bacterium]|jgi:putative transposase
MKKRFTEEQIIKILNRNRSGEKAKDLARDIGVSQATIFQWKKKFAGMTVNEAKRLRELELENAKLKRLVADQALNIEVLKDVNSKKW